MPDIVHALVEYRFLQLAFLSGILSSISCGIVGTYVVTKRISFISGGIAHAVLGGMGIVYYLNSVHSAGLNPLWGAITAAVVSAAIIGAVSLKRDRETDIVVSALWSIGMAIGIVFIAKSPGYQTDLMSFLFGNILMVSESDLHLIVVLDAVVVAFGIVFYNRLVSISFDDDFARVQGLRVNLFYFLILGITSLTIVALVQVVGLILVIALLTLPPAIARRHVSSVWKMMVLSMIMCLFFTVIGLWISYLTDLPSGASIILVTSLGFLISHLYRMLRKRGFPNSR